MQSKYNSILANETWEMIEFLEGKTALPCKWVYKKKYTANDPKPKYKARLVAKGFKQKKDVDFDEIFSPIVKMITLCLVFGLIAIENMELVQMDVKTTFLHGDLDEDVYMKWSKGFEVKPEKPTRVELVLLNSGDSSGLSPSSSLPYADGSSLPSFGSSPLPGSLPCKDSPSFGSYGCYGSRSGMDTSGYRFDAEVVVDLPPKTREEEEEGDEASSSRRQCEDEDLLEA
ncbi:hypothetical protein L7F22_010796 [Adiantum nelumboides]|nr:hypothetical protein [Adiantum nelumboides]